MPKRRSIAPPTPSRRLSIGGSCRKVPSAKRKTNRDSALTLVRRVPRLLSSRASGSMREEDGRRVDWANSVKLLRPVTIADAVAALSGEAEARCLAGGQTLVAMMNADLLRPSALVSLRHVEAVRGISIEQDGSVRIGAMATLGEIAAFGGFRGGQCIISAAARRIAHAPIRNAGTIGGSIAHGDPAADLPSALVAANAEIALAGPHGTRRVAAQNFFLDFLQTALEAGEV